MPKRKTTDAMIYDFIKSRPIPPTVREIAAEVGLQGHSSVVPHLHRLAAAGLIIIKAKAARGIVLVDSMPADSPESDSLSQRLRQAKAEIARLEEQLAGERATTARLRNILKRRGLT